MQAEQFYQSRQADWKALDQLLHRSQTDLHRLSPAEIDQLGRLYRAATSDLALAQRDFQGLRVTLYLNQLVARGHALIYRGDPLALNRLWHFVLAGFPRTYRALWPFTLAAALMLIIPAVLSGAILAWEPSAARWLVPAGAQPQVRSLEEKELWTDIPVGERPYASAFVMQNNIQVAFLAFGSGMLAGVVTVWIMVFNGLMLGGLLGLAAHYGVGWELGEFVIGHGVIELSVIFMAGGSGLRLGWAVLQPGWLHRRAALTQAAQQAVKLAIGSVPLLVIAGLIEGFISPAEIIPAPVKWGVGLVTGVGLYSYWLLAGRAHKRVRALSSK